MISCCSLKSPVWNGSRCKATVILLLVIAITVQAEICLGKNPKANIRSATVFTGVLFQGRVVPTRCFIKKGMKTHRYLTAALCGSALIFSVNAEKVRFEQLPIELKDKIRVHSGAAPIEDVDRQTKAGKTVYEVAFKKNGQHTELKFDDQGELIDDQGKQTLDSRKISYNELPDVVRKTLESRVTAGEVNDVDRQVKNGLATYEIGFKKNGQQQELVISQDGRILRDVQAAGAPATGASGTSSFTREKHLSVEPITLSASQKVQLTQLPAEVQRAITTAAAGARIEDVERGIWQGQNIYQAAFKENGKHVEVQIRENGTVLHDPRAVRRDVASASSRSPEYASLTSLVPLSSGAKIERKGLPGTVERRLLTHIQTDKIEDIERGTWQGKTIYQVAFKDQTGKHVELQIDERGNIVFDPRTQR